MRWQQRGILFKRAPQQRRHRARIFVKREAVRGVDNGRNPRVKSGNAADKSRLRGMSMNQVVRIFFQKSIQLMKAAQIAQGTDIPPDHIQIHHADAARPEHLLANRIGRQNVDLPSGLLRHFGERQNNASSAAPL
jgi:hypothetical protein